MAFSDVENYIFFFKKGSLKRLTKSTGAIESVLRCNQETLLSSVELSSLSQVILKSQHQKTSRPYPVRRHQTGYVYRILFYEKENCRKVYCFLDTH